MNYDVLIVGASASGAACAILLRQLGLSVRVIEKVPDSSRYKKLCTHFIQPSAVPVLTQLGMAHLSNESHSVRTQAAFITSAGIVDPIGGYGDDGRGFALNLERAVLDPALRQQAVRQGAEIGYGEQITEAVRTPQGWRLTVERHGDPVLLAGRFLIAADGRTSRLASMLGNQARHHENQRATFFAYCSGIASPSQNRSLFAHHQNGMAFLYPLINGRTLLSAYIDKETARQWQEQDPKAELIRFFSGVPFMPSVSQAVFETPVIGYHDYPNLVRHPVCGGVAFIGDAVQSLDPMSGVGCSFALQSAAMLAQAVASALQEGQLDETLALKLYEQQFNAYFPAHARGIIADSLIAKEEQTQRSVFQTIVNDDALQRHYRDLTGRLITPAFFQNAFLVSKIRQQSLARKAQEAL
ncbi:NAD(P)/FAD-dependent oxidoreductase [Dickeya chrysanthemi]|uniref:NAD(P)/FAD-dependent oxidoreductase n=1 Tax=Dickeya chrysanthemi TaxID=556 RepID=UPI00301A7340